MAETAGTLDLNRFVVETPIRPERFGEPQGSGAREYLGGGAGGSMNTLLLYGAVVLGAILVAYWAFCRATGKGRWSGQSLGHRVAARGWTLYTVPGCSWCKKQLRELGEYPKLVICGAAPGVPNDQGTPFLCSSISGFPFWANDTTRVTRTGFQDAESLEQMATSQA
jgi:hypothetical protein